GFLTGIAICQSSICSGYARLKVVIDGTTIIDGISSAINFVVNVDGYSSGENSLPMLLRFNSSVQVSVYFYNAAGTAHVSYLLD
ncbi:MAG: hypothetical protein ACPLRU_08990, partial [Desulfofundulus sp.]